jgi:hypothetical protein
MDRRDFVAMRIAVNYLLAPSAVWNIRFRAKGWRSFTMSATSSPRFKRSSKLPLLKRSRSSRGLTFRSGGMMVMDPLGLLVREKASAYVKGKADLSSGPVAVIISRSTTRMMLMTPPFS